MQWNYSDYIASPQWQQKRQQRLERDRHTCQGCGITQEQLDQLGWAGLQVHHKNNGPPTYRYPAALGNETLDDLLTLCPDCHDGITQSVRKQRYKLDPRKIVPSPDQAVGERKRPIFKHSSKIPNDLPNTVDQANRRQRNHPPQWADRRSAQQVFQIDEGDQQQAQKD